MYGVLRRLRRVLDAPGHRRPPAPVRLALRRPRHPRRRPQRLPRHEGPQALARAEAVLGRDPVARPRRGQDARRGAAGVVAPTARAAQADLRPPRDVGPVRSSTTCSCRPRSRGRSRPCPSTRRRRGRPVGPRAARPRPRALRGAHARTSGTRSRSPRRSAVGTARLPATSSRSSFNWADQKERELATAGGRRHQGAHPLPDQRRHDGARADVPGGPQPRAARVSQSTISIHADGQVVVWLGGMRHPPFDTEAARARAAPGAQRDGRRPPPQAPGQRLAALPDLGPRGPGEPRSPRRRARPDRDREPHGPGGRGRAARPRPSQPVDLRSRQPNLAPTGV